MFATNDVQGELRTTFDAGTTDAVRWIDLTEIDELPHVELVDSVAERLA